MERRLQVEDDYYVACWSTGQRNKGEGELAWRGPLGSEANGGESCSSVGLHACTRKGKGHLELGRKEAEVAKAATGLAHAQEKERTS